MLPLLAAALPAVAGLVGTLFTNSAQQASADKQMDFQKNMDNSKYQRTMADMRQAGLNPMLAYSQGGGSAPGGAQASMQNVGTAAIEGMQKGVSSAAQASLMKEQLANLSMDTRLKLAQASGAVEQAKLANANSAVVMGTMPYQIESAANSAYLTGTQADLLAPNARRARLENDYLSSDVGKALAVSAIAGNDANAASSAIKNLNPGDWIGKTFKSVGW